MLRCRRDRWSNYRDATTIARTLWREDRYRRSRGGRLGIGRRRAGLRRPVASLGDFVAERGARDFRRRVRTGEDVTRRQAHVAYCRTRAEEAEERRLRDELKAVELESRRLEEERARPAGRRAAPKVGLGGRALGGERHRAAEKTAAGPALPPVFETQAAGGRAGPQQRHAHEISIGAGRARRARAADPDEAVLRRLRRATAGYRHSTILSLQNWRRRTTSTPGRNTRQMAQQHTRAQACRRRSYQGAGPEAGAARRARAAQQHPFFTLRAARH